MGYTTIWSVTEVFRHFQVSGKSLLAAVYPRNGVAYTLRRIELPKRAPLYTGFYHLAVQNRPQNVRAGSRLFLLTAARTRFSFVLRDPQYGRALSQASLLSGQSPALGGFSAICRVGSRSMSSASSNQNKPTSPSSDSTRPSVSARESVVINGVNLTGSPVRRLNDFE